MVGNTTLKTLIFCEFCAYLEKTAISASELFMFDIHKLTEEDKQTLQTISFAQYSEILVDCYLSEAMLCHKITGEHEKMHQSSYFMNCFCRHFHIGMVAKLASALLFSFIFIYRYIKYTYVYLLVSLRGWGVCTSECACLCVSKSLF